MKFGSSKRFNTTVLFSLWMELMTVFFIFIVPGNNAWILMKNVFRQRFKYKNDTMWFNGLLCSDQPFGQGELIHTVSAGFIANFTVMKRLQKVTWPSLEIVQHIWNWHAMISDLAFKENKKRLHWWIMMKSLIDQHRRLNHFLSSTDWLIHFSPWMLLSKSLSEKRQCRNTQDVHLNQFHSLPLLIKLCAKKALLAATLGHQPDRLIMFAVFWAKRCTYITA